MKGVLVPGVPKPKERFRVIYELGSTHALNGYPVSGGRVYITHSGMTMPVNVFMDEDMLIPAPWPVILDMKGEADIFIAPGQAVTVLVQDARGEAVVQYETRS